MDQQSVVDSTYVDLTKLTAWMDGKGLDHGPLENVSGRVFKLPIRLF
ncbi:MAG: hypothetical protein ACI8TX_002848 [Hyphomicrobiaceae bacterium]|jgi:hypothetical protein